MSLASSLKRGRTESPAPNKRRPPPTYQPTALQQLSYPSCGVQHVAPAEEGMSAVDSSWVARTEELQLATPPAEGAWDDYNDDEDHEMVMDALDAPPTFPTQLQPHPLAEAAFYPFNPHNPIQLPSAYNTSAHPPHQPPPLISNLAGSPHAAPPSVSSPAMSRSSSDDDSIALRPDHFSPHVEEPLDAMNVQPLPQESSASPVIEQDDVLAAVGSRRPSRTRAMGSAGAATGAGAGGGGGQVRISMGYRADCDKCVRRVQGHYSHVVPVE